MTREHILELLEINGFVLTRAKNHLIFRGPKGIGTLVLSKTPSDWRAEENNLARLRRMVQASGRTFLESKEKEKRVETNAFNPPKIIIPQQALKFWDAEALRVAREAKKEGMSNKRVVKILTELGYRTRPGKCYTEGYIDSQLKFYDKKEGKVAKETKQAKKTTSDNDALIDLVLKSDLTKEKKLAVLEELL